MSPLQKQNRMGVYTSLAENPVVARYQLGEQNDNIAEASGGLRYDISLQRSRSNLVQWGTE